VSPLNKVLWRDLWHLRGQVVAAALVVACGVMAQVSMRSAYISLEYAQANYYNDYRFADVFAHLSARRKVLADEIRALPGVAQVRTRVVAEVTLDVPGLLEPASGRLVAIPERQKPVVNDLYLRRGRYIEASHPDEVLVSEVFCTGQQTGCGRQARRDTQWPLARTDGGRHCAVAEYIYEVGQGMIFPDNKRFGVLWMGREGLAAAFNMQGAFNDVSLTLSHGAEQAEVIARLDQLLLRYGGLSAYGRADQLSNRFSPTSWARSKFRRPIFGDLSGGSGVPHLHRAVAPGGDAAHADRVAQGFRLFQSECGPALS